MSYFGIGLTLLFITLAYFIVAGVFEFETYSLKKIVQVILGTTSIDIDEYIMMGMVLILAICLLEILIWPLVLFTLVLIMLKSFIKRNK